jgi:hypothetical protein
MAALTLGELARRAGMGVETVRFYAVACPRCREKAGAAADRGDSPFRGRSPGPPRPRVTAALRLL